MNYRNQCQKELENNRQERTSLDIFFIKSLQAEMIIPNWLCTLFWKHTGGQSTLKRFFLPALKMALFPWQNPQVDPLNVFNPIPF